MEIEFTPTQVGKIGHWLSEWLDDAAPLNEAVWCRRAESMVASPTFQEVMREILSKAPRDSGVMS